ncbi:MAG TPA: VOC family protein [Polyangiaceae bacterium]|nr:VOC family protein [Polyangiaceae bacterium]HVZ37613.1 VOC family protein [Polyangiaceae bacterium]
MTIGILGIDNMMFGVRDLDEAISFYERIGFVVRFRVPAPPIALFAVGNERPGLLLRQEKTPTPGRFWVEVRNADAVQSALAERGLQTATVETATGRTVEVTDPSGNVVGYADYRKRAELARH